MQSKALLFIFLFGFSIEGLAWSSHLHDLALKESVSALSAEERVFYDELFSGVVSLEKIAGWADKKRDLTLTQLFDSFGEKVPESFLNESKNNTKRWHYHNNFYPERDYCKVKNRGKLIQMAERIEGALFSSTLSRKQQAILLAFQLHLIQDLHQPLHTTTRLSKDCKHDLGGNKTCVKRWGKHCKMNLHQQWDRSFNVIQSGLAPVNSAVDVSKPNFRSWVEESSEYIPLVYSDKLSKDEYFKQSQDIVKARVVKMNTRALGYLKRFYGHSKNQKVKELKDKSAKR